jgi:hypothetical protein
MMPKNRENCFWVAMLHRAVFAICALRISFAGVDLGTD